VADRADEFRALGSEVAAASMSRPEALARYFAQHPMPFPVLADPDRAAYAAFGLGRTSWARLLRPAIVWKYSRMVLRGARVRRVPEGEDALQLGGDFLIRGDRTLRWAHRGADPTDRPTVDELLQAIRDTA
jgi:AhpC/TSA antioxidant enzyme